jgi:hypothetical protein
MDEANRPAWVEHHDARADHYGAAQDLEEVADLSGAIGHEIEELHEVIAFRRSEIPFALSVPTMFCSRSIPWMLPCVSKNIQQVTVSTTLTAIGKRAP